MNNQKLVVVQVGPKQWIKMYEADAIAKGLYKPPQTKQKAQTENKMVTPVENKQVEIKQVEIKQVEKDDLTEIVGVGKATAENLYGMGICTFEDLADVDVETLPTSARAAVKRYQEGL